MSLGGYWKRYTYPNGDTYEGEWNKDGRKHGEGMLVLTDGTKFVGHFTDGFCEGIGLLKFPDGTSYAGYFAKGKYHGVGTFSRVDGMKYEGDFANGRVEGLGIITFPDNTNGRPKQEGYFMGTELVNNNNATDSILKAREATKKAADTARSVVSKTAWMGQRH
ncbi:MORN repeat-containing protein 4-like [Exaiptasia diaphana]|uniref:MORN repeat-containing protein 4 n=1 Tax=Exaiptasia diaphana TaxID=2652724 RepID=A0A913XRY1_EXADI|nr:MORN repeat-containing protein 4-like [Exaiptasia diaphana]